MSIYDVSIPSNVELYVEQFRSLIAFEVLKPDNMLKLVDTNPKLKLLLIRYGLSASNGVNVEMPASLASSG
jgi:hypothetical protein